VRLPTPLLHLLLLPLLLLPLPHLL
jgi:hypothetical protein